MRAIIELRKCVLELCQTGSGIPRRAIKRGAPSADAIVGGSFCHCSFHAYSIPLTLLPKFSSTLDVIQIERDIFNSF